MPDSQPKGQIELIDFGSETPPARLSYTERVAYGEVSVSRCTLEPNPGTEIGATQYAVVIHEGTPFDMEWRLPESRWTERQRIVAGELHVNSADRPIFLRWTNSPRALVIALEQPFIKQIAGEAFDGNEPTLTTQIGIRDPVVEGMAAAWRRELAERGAGGSLYTEALGSALAVHLFRAYGDGFIRSPPIICLIRLGRTSSPN